jgi:hypothetical protein
MSIAAVFFAGYPVGPVCARRAGLTALAAKGTNKVLTLGPAMRSKRHQVEDTQLALPLEAP